MVFKACSGFNISIAHNYNYWYSLVINIRCFSVGKICEGIKILWVLPFCEFVVDATVIGVINYLCIFKFMKLTFRINKLFSPKPFDYISEFFFVSCFIIINHVLCKELISVTIRCANSVTIIYVFFGNN